MLKWIYYFKISLMMRRLKRAMIKLQDAQQESLMISRGEKPEFNLWETTKRKVSRLVSRCFCDRDKIEAEDYFIMRLAKKGTFENTTLRSFGFFFLIALLIYSFYFYFIYFFNNSNSSAATFCIILGGFLTVGISFSSKLRCSIMLCFPYMFGKAGRSAIIAFAYIVAFNGPLQNTINNADILAESIACGQELLANQTKMRMKEALAPLRSVVDSVREIIHSLKQIAKDIKTVLKAVAQVTKEIISSVKHSIEWLRSKFGNCSEKLGDAFNICMSDLQDAFDTCEEVMGFLSFLCKVIKLVRYLCYLVKFVGNLCGFLSLVAEAILAPFNKLFREAKQRLEQEFDVNVTLTHVFDYKLEESKSLSDIREEVMLSVKNKTEWLTTVVKYSEFLMLLFVFLVFFSTLRYQSKFKRLDFYDNFFITTDLVEYDRRRCLAGKSSIFPLTIQEKMKYVKSSSIRLSLYELKSIVNSMLVILLSSIQIGFIILLDYSLYWILEMVATHGRLSAESSVPSYAEIVVKGKGVLSDMFGKMSDAFGPMTGKVPPTNTAVCFPDPVTPDYDRYQEIGLLLSFAFTLSLIQPYGLRLRHIIVGSFYPKRKPHRASWLYNHIFRTRGSFLKFLRRKIRRNFFGDTTLHDIGFLEYISSRNPCLEKLFTRFNIVERRCLGCGLKDSKSKPLKGCMSEDCKALYCEQCFSDIGDQCIVCLSPKDYGDESDISEERDSSEDEVMKNDQFDLGKMLTNKKWVEERTIDGNLSRTPSYAYIPKDTLIKRRIKNWP